MEAQEIQKTFDGYKEVFKQNTLKTSQLRHDISYNDCVSKDDVLALQSILEKEIECLWRLKMLVDKENWQIYRKKLDCNSPHAIEANEIFVNRKNTEHLKIGIGYVPRLRLSEYPKLCKLLVAYEVLKIYSVEDFGLHVAIFGDAFFQKCEKIYND